MRASRRLFVPALLAALAVFGSACWIRLWFISSSVTVEDGTTTTEVLASLPDATVAVCGESLIGAIGCSYIVGGEFLCSTGQLIREFGLLGALVDPVVVQVPAEVSDFSGTYDDGSGAQPLLVTRTDAFAVEPGVLVTAEAGQTFLIVELPPEVAAGLPEGPPSEAGTDFDFAFGFTLPGDDPLSMKAMLTLRIDVAGQTFYVPMLPCTTDFASVPAIEVPVPIQDFDLLAAVAAALGPDSACRNVARDYSGIDLDLDPRLLYKAVPGAKPGAQVTLTDAFGSASFEVAKTAALGMPADRDLLYPDAPADPEHLLAYGIRPASGGTQAPKRRLRTANRYGVQTVEITKPDRLLLPAAASLTGPVPPLTDPEVDAFACYRARAAKGEPGLAKGTSAFVTDAHGSAVYELGKPSRLCRPADVDGQTPGAEEHPGELLCFKAKPVPKVCQNAPQLHCRKDADCGAPCIAQPKPGALAGVDVADLLGAQRLEARKPSEVCIPSTTAPAPPPRARARSSFARDASAAFARLFSRGGPPTCEPASGPS